MPILRMLSVLSPEGSKVQEMPVRLRLLFLVRRRKL